ncbi:MAG: hypothetical protein K0Q94_2976 [Paenibacillus sp.]|jgi:hypothetical protein|nr:hypothetical protein [Paenibacillus sp.]
MTRKRRLAILVSAAILLAPAWASEKAEAGSTLSTSVTISEQTELFDRPEEGGTPVGALAAFQSLEVDWTGREDPAQLGNWIRVKTWLGAKWIRDDASVLYGGYAEERKEVTLLNTVALYDGPDPARETGASIGPQQLHVTGTVAYSPKYADTARQFSAGSGMWYRVKTWLGDKWIKDPAILEHVPVWKKSYAMKLTGDETAYPVPYETEGKGEKVAAGVVQVVAFGWEGKGPWSPYWYQIEWKGGTRWITPKHEALKYYRTMDKALEIGTEVYYSDKPYSYATGEDRLLAPGTYQAVEATGEWVRLQSDDGPKWISLRVLLDDPQQIVPTEEEVEVDADTESYYFPIGGERLHAKGHYSGQKVRAYETWTAADGTVWYNLASGETEWVKAKPAE